jgi:hypothetical protein
MGAFFDSVHIRNNNQRKIRQIIKEMVSRYHYIESYVAPVIDGGYQFIRAKQIFNLLPIYRDN